MSRTWVTADPHFGHGNILTFKRRDGTPLRPFSSLEEMNSELIRRWNEVVGQDDRVYVLGDVAMRKSGLGCLAELKGRKVLVKGNHDQEKLSLYVKHFDDIRAYVVKKGFIMSHIPIHENSLSRWQFNIHGHLHADVVLKDGQPDPRYICASVEHHDYYPMNLQIVLDKLSGG